jgi:hypothetical protein
LEGSGELRVASFELAVVLEIRESGVVRLHTSVQVHGENALMRSCSGLECWGPSTPRGSLPLTPLRSG